MLKNPDCRLLKNLLEADRTDKYTSGGVPRPFVGPRRLSAAKHTSLFGSLLGYRMRQRQDENLIRATAHERSAAFVHRRA